MSDIYRVIASPARAEIKVKGSRFIAEVFPVATEADVEAQIAQVKKREHAATHHCWAYRLGPDGAASRFNDDGEPAGTAGRPILRHIDAKGVTNTLAIVTRYFGGTKLGTGGLIRAYGDAAAAALAEAPAKEETVLATIRIRFPTKTPRRPCVSSRSLMV